MSRLKIPRDYESRVYAGWLGKGMGVYLGGFVERLPSRKEPEEFGPGVERFMFPKFVLAPCPDISLALIAARAVEDYGPDVTTYQFGESWLNYLGDQQGTLDWAGYGVSAEHTAYCNLTANIHAPRSGSVALNGLTLADQVGGQASSDIWGMLVPAHAPLAASYAESAASVAHDANGLHGARFVAALVSGAFEASDPQELIEIGLSQISEQNAYALAVRAMVDFHAEHPDDWRAACAYILETFGEGCGFGRLSIIPNAAVLVTALLYGAGDFARTMQIALNAGWSICSNAGNLGMILGVAGGLAGIPESWRASLGDGLVATSLIGARSFTDLAACTELVCKLGRQIIGESEPEPARSRYHFTYPGSVQGFEYLDKRGKVVDLCQVSHAQGGALQATVERLHNRGRINLFTKTIYSSSMFSDDPYAMTLTPKIVPGQQVRARCYLPEHAPAPLKVALYVHDLAHDKDHRAKPVVVAPGTWQDLTYQIPELDEGARLSEVGVQLRNPTKDYWNGTFLLESLDWEGSPCFSYDFSQAQPELGGIDDWTFLRGYWRVENGAYHGSGVDINETYSGDIAWDDLTLTVRMTPLVGEYHHCLFRVQGALRSYAVGLAPSQQLIIYKNANGYRPVERKRFEWQPGTTYEISVTVEGAHIAVQVDGEPMLEWTDHDEPYLHGQIGLGNFSGCHTSFESVRLS